MAKKLLKESPYLWPIGFRHEKEPIYRRLIRGLFYRLDEPYIPADMKMSMTYDGGDRRGLRLSRTVIGRFRGVQEFFFEMPKDILKSNEHDKTKETS